MESVLVELTTRRRRRPFVPFAIVVKDGRRLEVTRPLQFAFSPHIVIVLDDRDRSEKFRRDDITELQALHPVG